MKKKNNFKKYKAHLFALKYLFYDIGRWSGFPLLFYYRMKKIYESKEAKKHHKKGAMIISNHILYNDVMILQTAFWYRRLYSVAMKELFKGKFFSWILRHLLIIPIDREKFSMESFRHITNLLKGGNTVMIFPEGHVSHSNDNPMASFKSGAVLMALQAGVKIIPTYHELRPHWWNRQKLVIGDPIDVKALMGDKMDMNKIEEITKYLYEKEQQLKQLYHKEK